MSLADLIRGKRKCDSAGFATVTLATFATDGPTIRPSVANVATVTVADPENHESAGVAAAVWLMHFPDRNPAAVAFAPAVDHAGALAAYPAAIAAEPMAEPPDVPIPADLAAMFDACERAGLYDDADRAALPAMLAIDAEATRGLIEATHYRIGDCRRCRYFRRPGQSEGYCTGRDDLPHVYGLMRELPDDNGARCGAFDEGRERGESLRPDRRKPYPSSRTDFSPRH